MYIINHRSRWKLQMVFSNGSTTMVPCSLTVYKHGSKQKIMAYKGLFVYYYYIMIYMQICNYSPKDLNFLVKYICLFLGNNLLLTMNDSILFTTGLHSTTNG